MQALEDVWRCLDGSHRMLGAAQGTLVLSFFSSCHGKMLQQTQLPGEKACLSSVYLIVCQVSYTVDFKAVKRFVQCCPVLSRAQPLD